jgi:glutamine synthetase
VNALVERSPSAPRSTHRSSELTELNRPYPGSASSSVEDADAGRPRLARAGFSARTASELEFFVYTDTYRDAHERGYVDLRPAGWYVEDYHLLQGARIEPFIGACRQGLRDSDIPVETSKGEWGRGQHELNIRHAPVLEMADRHVLMKHAMKEIADQMGCSVTFMAKPHESEAGSSCHLHLSLWRGDTAAFPADDGVTGTDEFRWFLGGWIAHARDFMLCYAPTINSYKRYRSESWAPTTLAWARDNRTVGFRIVGTGPDLRIECRVPGADVNPYLAYAAVLASGLAGIEGRIEPPPEFRGDAYRASDLPALPTTLDESLQRFRSSTIAREAFGDAVLDHTARFAEVEIESFHQAVTDWERVRYFERI